MARGKQQGQTKRKWSLKKRLRQGFRSTSKKVLASRRNKKRSSLSVSEEFGPGTRKNKRFRRRK